MQCRDTGTDAAALIHAEIDTRPVVNAAVQTGDGGLFGCLGPCLKGARCIAQIVVGVIHKGDVAKKVVEDLGGSAPDWTECPEVYSGKGGVAYLGDAGTFVTYSATMFPQNLF